MGDRHDYVALEWVKSEIAETLKVAHQAIEHLLDDPHATHALSLCLACTHQVHGSLQMLQLHDAALLAEELERFTVALQQSRVSDRAAALRLLLQALGQLPVHLDQLQTGHALPLELLSLVNDLRRARGEHPLPENAVLIAPAQALPTPDSTLPASQGLAEFPTPKVPHKDRHTLPDSAVVIEERARLVGPDRDAMRSVLSALCEELVRVKEQLDLFVRSDRQHSADLDSLLAPLRQIADTLAVLGFGQPRKVIIDQLAVVQNLAQGQREPDDATLMDVAGALLYVEATLAGMVGTVDAEREDDTRLPTTDLTQIHQIVIREARACLQQAKDMIVDCIDADWDRQHVQALPSLLTQVRGALAMISLHRAAVLVEACQPLVRERLLRDPRHPDAEELDHLADVISSLDYYLERLCEDADAPGDALLDVAEKNLAALGFFPREHAEPGPAESASPQDPEAVARGAEAFANDVEPASTAIDPQLLEIFRTEAETHLTSLKQFLRRAAEQLPLQASDELQRALHTLKGSASMAGVWPIAELASAVDQLTREYKAHLIALDVDELALLLEVERLLQVGLRQLTLDPLAVIPGARSLIDRTRTLLAQRLEQYLNDAPGGRQRIKRDPQLINNFLAQGMDILLDADSLLQRWQQHPGERHELSALLDELTTLGEGAHLADLHPMDELCEALLDLYGAVEESSLAVSAAFFHEAQSAHEALINMLDELAAGQEITPQLARVAALRGLLDESLDPSATGLIRSDGSRNLSIRELGSAIAELASDPLDIEPDNEIAALFLEEALDILDNADHALQRWLDDPDNAAPLLSLQRDLHTLKGGARMAEVEPVGVLAEELEGLYEGLVDRRYSHSDTLAQWLRHSHERLSVLLEQLQNCEPLESPGDLIDALRGMRQTSAQAAQMPASVSVVDGPGDDCELLEIFLEEGFDIIENSGAALARWQAEPTNRQELEILLRDLHTLKGGARMVEITPVGDLAHELEFLYEGLSAGDLKATPALFGLLQSSHDRLAQMLDATRAGQALPSAERLIDEIINFSHPLLSEPQVVAAAAPKAEAAASVPEAGADMVKVSAELLDDLVNLAGETSIFRGRIEQQVNDARVALSEMETTIERMRDQLRRLDTETQGRILSRQQSDGERLGYEEFDPLEMDRHSQLQQLSRALFESASDLLDLKETLDERNQDAQNLLQQQGRINTELQEGLMRTRMVPFERMLPRLKRIVRQVAGELGKDVEFVVGNAEGEMDRNVLERMAAPLEHMLRNSVDHGLESAEVRIASGKPAQGRITLDLAREGGDIIFDLRDDGAGVPLDAVRRKAIKRGLLAPDSAISDRDVLQFILQPGFSTAEKITQISGRGVGMDVVHEEVRQLGGSMSIESTTGQGVHFRIRLPFTVSVNRALMVQCADDLYAIPLNTIDGIVRVLPNELEGHYRLDPPAYQYAGQHYELCYLGNLLKTSTRPKLLGQSSPLPVLLVQCNERHIAVQVDAMAGTREIVVKSLGPQFAAVQGLSGATILGDGRVVLILDLLAPLRAMQGRLPQRSSLTEPDAEPHKPLLVMVVDDSVTVRKVTSRLLERHGMSVLTAKDGVDAMLLLEEHLPDLMLLDIEMPRMDGFEVATQVRHDERLQHLPIIMITSRTGQKHRDRAMAIGVNDYLGKPYQESVLLDSIALWSKHHA